MYPRSRVTSGYVATSEKLIRLLLEKDVFYLKLRICLHALHGSKYFAKIDAKSGFSRRRQNLDRTRSDYRSDHWSDHGSNHVNWIRNFAQQAKIKPVWHTGAQAPLRFFFLCPKTPCSYFHGCVEECCVVLPWTKASEWYVSFHQSVKKNATQSTVAS